jgi:hypothetical protein
MHGRLPAERDPEVAGKPVGKHRDRIAGLNAQPGGNPQALKCDRDAGLLRDLLPHLRRAAGPAPQRVAILARDRD